MNVGSRHDCMRVIPLGEWIANLCVLTNNAGKRGKETSADHEESIQRHRQRKDR